jgi:hypothetical protein
VTLSVYELFDYRNLARSSGLSARAALEKAVEERNDNVSLIIKSGARGDLGALMQMVVSRGEIVGIPRSKEHNPLVPIDSNLVDGMPLGEAFASCRGSRKTTMDKTLKTADAGYLMRQIVELAQAISIVEEDCGVSDLDESQLRGLPVSSQDGDEERLASILFGRTLVHPQQLEDEEISVVKSMELARSLAKKIIASGETLLIRSPLTCRTQVPGICQKCYGLDMATMKYPPIGTRVGLIAAQSIGEPGTQLVLRTFHSGGVAATASVTTDLEKVGKILHQEFAHDLNSASKSYNIEDFAKALQDNVSKLSDIYEKYARIARQHFEVLLRGLIEWDGKSVLPHVLRMSERFAKPLSWLEGASFERTSKMIARAVLSGESAKLKHFKERIIVGQA